jgi:hypothetical protein
MRVNASSGLGKSSRMKTLHEILVNFSGAIQRTILFLASPSLSQALDANGFILENGPLANPVLRLSLF